MRADLERSRYGGTSLWVLRRNLGGTRARRLFEMVELHFSEESRPLVLDLREADSVDSLGADLLERLRRRHPSLAVVGLPRDYEILPLAIRTTLASLAPARGIVEALGTLREPTQFKHRWDTRRRHERYPVTIPVEISLGALSTAATLRDLSLGGTRIGRVPSRWIRELEGRGEEASEITISGLPDDPLGREVAGLYNRAVLNSRAVHVLPGQSGIGVRFSATGGAPPAA